MYDLWAGVMDHKRTSGPPTCGWRVIHTNKDLSACFRQPSHAASMAAASASVSAWGED